MPSVPLPPSPTSPSPSPTTEGRAEPWSTTSSPSSAAPSPTTPPTEADAIARDTPSVATRVTSTRLVGRSGELPQLEGALADAAAARPSLAFVAGDSGVGKTRLVAELERSRAHPRRARPARRDDRARRGRAALRRARRRPARARPRRRPTSSTTCTRASAPSSPACCPRIGPGADRLPPRGRSIARRRRRLFEALLELLDAPGRGRARRPRPGGPPLGRPLDPRLRRLPGPQPLPRARPRRRDVPRRRAPPPPPAAPAAGRARARLARRPPRAPAADARRARLRAGGHPRRAALARARRPPVRPHRGQPALPGGGPGGRDRRPRDAPGHAPRRAHGAHRAASARTPRRSCASWPSAERADHALLAETSGLDAPALRAALRDAVASHLIVAGADGRHAFRHALLREVVVDDLLPGEREGLHLALARALGGPRRGRAGRGGHRLPLQRGRRPPAPPSPRASARRRRRAPSTPTARRRRCSSASSSCGTTSPRPPSSSAPTASAC